MYFDVNKTLTYNALYNFIIGNRGGGKTYGTKEYAIKDFLKTGSQFIYLRRYDTELDRGKKEKYFDDIAHKFPDHEFKVKGYTAYIDDKPAGHFMVLSTAKVQKSVAFNKVNKIIFDEFILDAGYHRYLPDEVTNFLEFYETVARMRDDVRVFFLSNAITVTNPYFLYWKIQVTNKEFQRHGDDMLVVLSMNDEFIEKKKQTRFGKIIQGTAYGDYAMENQFLRDDDYFIGKKTGNAHYSFTMIYKGTKYGVWIDYKEGKYYVSRNIDTSCKMVFSLTQADHTPNTMLLKGRSSNLKMFTKNYQLGNVIFEDINIKNVCYEIIRLFLL